MTPDDDIVCYEEGSNQPPWTGLATLLSKDIVHLRKLSQNKVISLDEQTGDTVKVSGIDKVGLVALPSGRRLVIRSKIDNLVLLDWLVYLGECPPLEAWLPEPGVATGDFHKYLARLFLFEIEKVTRLHLRKDYMPVSTESPTIRGRILSSQLSRRLHRLPCIPQKHRLRTLDTKYNIVLAVTLDKLPMLLADASPNDRQLLAVLRDQWAHIEREIPDPVSAVNESQWASPPGYLAALQLARLILTGWALDSSTRMGGQAFTLSLDPIWEGGLRRMFNDLGKETSWRCVPDAARTRHWDDRNGWLRADVIGERDDLRWVLDAKYKRAFGNEAPDDRVQMCAYALAFEADRVSLTYPTAPGSMASGVRTLLGATIGNRRVLIDSVELPMWAGPTRCMMALKEICQQWHRSIIIPN